MENKNCYLNNKQMINTNENKRFPFILILIFGLASIVWQIAYCDVYILPWNPFIVHNKYMKPTSKHVKSIMMPLRLHFFFPWFSISQVEFLLWKCFTVKSYLHSSLLIWIYFVVFFTFSIQNSLFLNFSE